MKLFTLFIFSLFTTTMLMAASPTVPGSNLKFTAIEGTQFSGNFTIGNGSQRIVVIKAGSPVTGVPVNGTEYSFNAAFGTPASSFTAAGEFVIARGTSNTFNVTNLTVGTVYYIAVFEYNGTGVNTQYLTLALTGNQSTAAAPTIQTSAFSSTTKTGNSITLNWVNGNGAGRIIIARKGAPVEVSPTDLTLYYGNENLGNGTKIGTDNYIVYKNTGNTVTVKSLEPNTVYHFAAFEFNGSTYPVYLKPGVAFNSATNAGPNTAPSSPAFNYIEGNSFYLAVNAGNGNRRLFIGKKESPVTAAPAAGQTYTANSAFGTPGTEIAPGEFVLSAAAANSIKITNLEPNTTYHFRVYDYDADGAGNNYYLTSTYAVKSGSTCITPTQAPTNIQLVSTAGTNATVKYTSGNGSYRLVLMKAGSAVNATPADLVKYTGSPSFGSGQQVTPGNYCLFSGINGTQFTVNNLVPGTTYHLAIYDFNGSDNPVYSSTTATFSFTVPLEPTVIAKSPNVTYVEGRSFRVLYTVGNGTKRLVIGKKAAAVTAKPTDFINYTANDNFGQGQEILPGEFVIASDEDNYIDVKGLDTGSTYHFAIFEYNINSEGNPDYLVSNYLATAGSTVGAPGVQTSVINAGNLTATSATIYTTNGNGANRLIVMKQSSAVNIVPEPFVKYTFSTAFGSPASLMSDGNYAIYAIGVGSSVSVTSLQPNTTYHVKAYDFNGSNEPVYLTTATGAYSFTTPEVPGATTPTVAASNPLSKDADGNKLTLQWANGNGDKRMVVMAKDNPVSFVPSAAASYTANAAFASGTDLGNGQFIIYNGISNTVDITNLLPSSVYHYTIYEFNGTGALTRYLTSSKTSGTANTVSAPTAPGGSLQSAPGSSTMQLNWTRGNGSSCLVVMKENTAITALPVNLSVYPANAIFKNGSQLAAGEYVVYTGTANNVNVTGLTPGNTYHFAVFEYNGSTAPVYNTSAFSTGSALTSGVLPVKLLYFNVSLNGQDAVLNWSTSSEINSRSFIIERSTDGNEFDAIATVQAAGISNRPIVYKYIDKNVIDKKLYYRLKQTDTDGTYTYSTTQVVSTTPADGLISVYPNPVRNQFTISFPGNQTNAIVAIYDMQGRLQIKQRIVKGQPIQSERLAKGVYHMLVQLEDTVFNVRIVK